METQTTTEQTKPVKLYARCEAAVWNPESREVDLNTDVNPKYLIQDLIQEIQVLSQQLAEQKTTYNELKTKYESLVEKTCETKPVEATPEEKL